MTVSAWTVVVLQFNVRVGHACLPHQIAHVVVCLSIATTDRLVVGGTVCVFADTRRLVPFIQGTYSTEFTTDIFTSQT